MRPVEPGRIAWGVSQYSEKTGASRQLKRLSFSVIIRQNEARLYG